MSNVRATVLLDIDETDNENLKANAEQFLRQALVEKAPSEEVEDNAVRDKPIIKIEDVDSGTGIVENEDGAQEESDYVVYSVEKDGELIGGAWSAESGAGAYASDYGGEVVELMNPEDPAVLLRQTEELAEVAHRLWTHWSQHIAGEEDISEDRLERWEQLWIPYEDLNEEDKQDDRRLVKRFLSEKPDYSFEIDTGAPK